MPTSFNILRGNTVTIANKPLTEGLMTIDTDKKKVSVDWDSNGTLERIGFSSGDVTANSNESGSNDLEGLLVGEKGYKVLPIDSDLVLGEDDITLSDIIDNKADIDDYGVDLIAKRVMTNLTAPTKNTDPYIYRKTPTAKTDVVDMHKIIGASVVWNQLCRISASDISKTENGVTFTDNRDGSYTISTDSNGATADTVLNIESNFTNVPKGTDVYYFYGNTNGSSNSTYGLCFQYLLTSDFGSGRVYKGQSASYTLGYFRIFVKSGTVITTPKTFRPQGTNLTAMFGTTVADYVYSLEQNESDTGIAWLQSYGFFTEDYYTYQTNKLESVCVSEKKMGGKNKFDNDIIYGDRYNGVYHQGNNYWTCRNLIPILPDTTYTFSGLTNDGQIGFYNKNQTYISNVDVQATTTFTTPANAKYLSVYNRVASMENNHQLELGSTETTYEPYSEPSTYPISPITLRGLFGVNNGKLTVDGDEYESNGNVTRNYEQRAYQSGDESLANAITDGTNTVVELATPTTETTTPFVEIQSDNASAKGNSVTVDAERGIMQNAVVDFTPIQDLHGYDKPWSGGSGKNKLPLTLNNIKAINTGGTWTDNVFSYRGLTFTINQDMAGNVTSIKVNGTCDVGTSTINYISFYFCNPLSDVLINEQSYIFTSGNSNGSTSTFCINIPYVGDDTEQLSFTYDNTKHAYARIKLFDGTTLNNEIFYPMIRKSTESSEFAPYSNICPISGRSSLDVTVNGETETINFPETVYGGTCDIVNGGTIITNPERTRVKICSLSWAYQDNFQRFVTVSIGNVIELPPSNSDKLDTFACECYNYKDFSHYQNGDISVSSTGNMFVKDSNYTDVTTWLNAVGDFYISYPLKTPQTISTPATTISLEKGTNTVTVDDNATISFDYRMRDTFISTEEFVDYGVNQGNRDIAIPCGHDSDYYQCFDLPELPTDNNTYLLTCTVTNGEPNITWERS